MTMGRFARLNSAQGPVIAGAVVAAIGVAALAGWLAQRPGLTTWKAGTIPMAPVTAILLVALAQGLVQAALSPPGGAPRRLKVLLSFAGALAAGTLLGLRLGGVLHPSETLGLAGIAPATDARVGFVSPITALCLLAANLALLIVDADAASSQWRRVLVQTTGAGLAVVGFAFAVTNLLGLPFILGAGTIPMALNTSLSVAIAGSALWALGAPRPPSPVPGGMKNARVLVAAFVLFTGGTILAGFAYYLTIEREAREDAEQQLEAIAALKVSGLTQWRQGRRADAALIYRNTLVTSLVARLLRHTPDPDALVLMEELFKGYQSYRRYDRLLLFDAGGALRLWLPSSAPPPSAALPAVPRALRTRETTLQDFYLEEPEGARLATVVPILDGRESCIGALVLRIDPTPFLYPFLEDWPTRSTSAETLLVRREGDSVLFLNNLRFDSDAAVRRRLPLSHTAVPAVRGALGETGVIEGPDYQGKAALAVVRAVPDSPWVLVTRISASELREPLLRQFWMVASIVGLVLLSAASGLGTLWRRQGLETLRKEARLLAALRASAARFEHLLRGSPAVIYALNLVEGRLVPTGVSGNIERLLGYPAEEVISASWWSNHVHPDDRSPALTAMAALAELDEIEHEYRFLRSDGTFLWVSDRIRVLRREGGAPAEAVGAWQDVTDRKHDLARTVRRAKLHAALSQCNEAMTRCTTREQLFDRICDTLVNCGGIDLAWIGLLDETRGTVSPVASAGEGKDCLAGATIVVDPSGVGGRGAAATAIRENRRHWVENHQLDPTTEPWWHERARSFGWAASLGLPLTSDSRVVGALTLHVADQQAFDPECQTLLNQVAVNTSFALDALSREAERARAEHRLRESERRYRTLFEESGLPMLVVEPENGRIVDANGAARAFYGWDRITLRQKTLAEVETIGEFEAGDTAASAGMCAGTTVSRHRVAGGETRDVEVFSGPLVVDGSARILAVITDITARRRAESEREQYYSFFHASGDLMAIADGAGCLSQTNPAFTEATGYSRDELRGVPVLQLMHAEDRSLAQDTITTNSLCAVETRLVRKDGAVRWMSWRVQHSADGLTYWTARDITAQKNMDADLRASLNEKEGLLKEVHHRVKNNLQVVKSLLSLEAARAKDPVVTNVLEEMQNRILSMAVLHEVLYRSGKFSALDLATYLRQVATQLGRTLAPERGRVSLRLDLTPISVDLEQAVPCGLVVNELISNAFKHGFPDGRRGEVRVALTRPDASGAVRVSVVNNGAGLPPDFERRRSTSLGLQLVGDLVSQLRGVLEVSTNDGVEFVLTFPAMPAEQRATAPESLF